VKESIETQLERLEKHILSLEVIVRDSEGKRHLINSKKSIKKIRETENTQRIQKKEMQMTIDFLRKKNRVLKRSKSYKIGRAITKPYRVMYRRKILGIPLRLTETIQKGKNKKILSKSDIKYADIIEGGVHKKAKNPQINSLKELRVAAIMDEFTYNSFRFECDIYQLTPDNWQEEIDTFKPHMLFVESAWMGKDEKWRFLLNTRQNSETINEVLSYARSKEITSIFWNKEDPSHTAPFLAVASRCDHVFTSDINSLEIYRDVLKHTNLYSLGFAAQPKINNPIKEHERADKISFAGSYYAKYKHRSANFKDLVEHLSKIKDIVIYDRNSNRNLGPDYEFPEEMKDYVKKSLPYSEISKAYKGYNYAINLNTVQTSPTMFARRVFELAACNTLVISNYSKGVKKVFGDLVISTNSGSKAAAQLNRIVKDSTYQEIYRLEVLRQVMQNHTYEKRLQSICENVFDNFTLSVKEPWVTAISYVSSQKEHDRTLENFNRQSYKAKKLIFVCPDKKKIKSDHQILDNISPSMRLSEIQKTPYVSFFNPKDYYGEHFLTDCMLAYKYSEADHVGKSAKKSNQYTIGAEIISSAMCSSVSSLDRKLKVVEYLEKAKGRETYTENTLSIDNYNYIPNSRKPSAAEEKATKKIKKLNHGSGIDWAGDASREIVNKPIRIQILKILSYTRIRKTYSPIKMSAEE
jgi:spore maturation protein CgeB